MYFMSMGGWVGCMVGNQFVAVWPRGSKMQVAFDSPDKASLCTFSPVKQPCVAAIVYLTASSKDSLH
jgi:hypothetical protein